MFLIRSTDERNGYSYLVDADPSGCWGALQRQAIRFKTRALARALARDMRLKKWQLVRLVPSG